MIGLKRKVTSYFKRRKLLLQNLSGKRITARDDFAELYVVARFVQKAKRTRLGNPSTSKGSTVFLVATAPSPHWTKGSHFILNDTMGKHVHALRSGLQVAAPRGGTVELD